LDEIKMTTPITGPGSTNALDALTQSGGSKPLDRSAFLKLLVEQLKHQDPLKPQDDSAFVAQLAQFSQLEQSMGINTRLDTLAAQNAGLANAQAVSLVGSTATVRGNLVTVDGTGVGTPVAFSLSNASNATTVTIRDQGGNAVRTMVLGARQAGLARITWDGRSDAGDVQPAGTYQVTVTATDAIGAPVSVSQETTGAITEVSFDKGYPVLELDNGIAVPISDLLKVAVPNPPTTSK
jgi:flagellar basal-body rod modification protein FlgD